MGFGNRFIESHSDRVVGLDIVRAAAILIVVYGHGVYFFPEKYHRMYYLAIPLIDGVSIFFVLSGFLIGGILLKIIENGQASISDLLHFWLRRWFRTLPNYFFVLAVLAIYQAVKYHNLGGITYKYIFFLQNFISPHPPVFPEAWSLCVEEWFYLLFPAIYFLLYHLVKNKSKSLLCSVIIFIVPPLIFRIIYFYAGINIDNWDSAIRKVVIFRMDSLMYGIIGAYLFRFHSRVWIKYKNPCLIASILMLIYLTVYWRSQPSLSFLAVYQYNLESMATLLSLPFFTQLKSIKSKFFTFIITFVSIISYSMYLLNYSIVQCRLIPFILSMIGLEGVKNRYVILLSYFLYWFFIITGAYLLYRYYEKPIMDMRNRINRKYSGFLFRVGKSVSANWQADL